VMRFKRGVLVCSQPNALEPSEQDHAHHAMKTVTKDATVQQGGTHDLCIDGVDDCCLRGV